MAERVMKRGWVYAMTHATRPGEVKIGYTTASIERRLKEHNLGIRALPDMPPFEMAFYVKAADCRRIEGKAHLALARCHSPPGAEWFRIDLGLAREVLELLSGPVLEPEARWPWPGLVRKHGCRNRHLGGGAMWGWFYDNYHALSERVSAPYFGWPALCYQIGNWQVSRGQPFRPPSPAQAQKFWESVCRTVAKEGWDETRGGRIDPRSPGKPAGPSLAEGFDVGGARAEAPLGALPVDAGQPRGAGRSVVGSAAELGGAGEDVRRGGPAGPDGKTPDRPDSAADLVSALPRDDEAPTEIKFADIATIMARTAEVRRDLERFKAEGWD